MNETFEIFEIENAEARQAEWEERREVMREVAEEEWEADMIGFEG